MKWIFGGCPFFGILVKEGTCPACGFPWSTDGTRDHVGVPEPEHPSRTLGYGLAKCLSPVMRCWEITPCYAGIQTDTDPAFTMYPSARRLHPNLCKFISATHRRVRNQPDTHRYNKIATPTFPAEKETLHDVLNHSHPLSKCSFQLCTPSPREEPEQSVGKFVTIMDDDTAQGTCDR